MPLRRDHRHIAQYGGHSGGAPPAFAPTDVAGLTLWLKSDTGVLDTGDAAISVDATAVKTWQDQSGVGNHFTQAVALARPVWKTNILNSKPVIRFTGSEYLRFVGTLDTGGDGTFFVVFKGVATGDKTLIASCDEGTAFESYFILRPTLVGGNRIAVLQHSEGDAADQVRNNTTVLADGTYYVGMWQSSGTAFTFIVNGAAQTKNVDSGADNGDWLGDTANRDSVTIGSLTASSSIQFYDGDVAEILYYNSAVGGTDLDNVEAYLGTRYNITMA